MAQRKLSWVQRWREERRAKRQRTADSPEKASERHTPRAGVIDVMLKAGGVERENRFKR
jgi:hypothetical protein